MPDQSRRNFFRAFIGQTLAWFGEAQGQRHLPLSALRLLPEEIVRRIEPVFFDDGEWQIEAGRLLAYDKAADDYREFRRFSEAEQALVDYFQQGLTLEAVAAEIASQFALPADAAFRQVADFFFELAELRVCHPAEMEAIETYFDEQGI